LVRIRSDYNVLICDFRKKVEVELSPQDLKQLEFERKFKEREQAKEQKKLVLDFKKLWFKPKEDLDVEDLKVGLFLHF
jgi:hypothetical protein